MACGSESKTRMYFEKPSMSMIERTSDSITVEVTNAATGVATDPEDGNEIHYLIVVGNSTVQSPQGEIANL